MLEAHQLYKAKEFIFRNGDLLTRNRFRYHFENGSKDAVLDSLKCYQNEDGGFGNGLELDIMCPESSGICTEVALGYLVELEVNHGEIIDGILKWVIENETEDGDITHPVGTVESYPHGNWQKTDSDRILSIAGLLGCLGINNTEIENRASGYFSKKYIPFPDELKVYMYPPDLYLRYSRSGQKFPDQLSKLKELFPRMLEENAWHHPLFFLHDRWCADDVTQAEWNAKAIEAVSTIQEDGGVYIKEYKNLPWWRPIWTLDFLISLKKHGILNL